MLLAMTCPHGRQPSICAVCVPILEAELETKRRREEEDDFNFVLTTAAIAAAID